MRKFIFYCSVLCLFFAARAHAQTLGTAVTVRTIPNSLYFWVDGVQYSDNFSAVWPVGSQHTLWVQVATQDGVQRGETFQFEGWSDVNGALNGNPVVITADPSIPEYDATFAVQYDLTLSFYSCPSGPCTSPGTVYVNGAPYTSNADILISAGTAVQLTATPNPGWAFGGWSAGPNQTISGFTDNVVMNGPTVAYPLFQTAQTVNLATVPAGLQVMADNVAVPTPIAESWGLGTQHSVGAVTPQEDSSGNWWVFGSWSDGGAATHAVSPNIVGAQTLTATYTPGAGVTLVTVPAGLSLNVDGRSNWVSYDFVWPVGSTHQINAVQQLDAQGNAWGFSSWSNGAAANQSYTVPAGGQRLTAIFTEMAHLSVSSPIAGLTVTVNGTACPIPCDSIQPAGTAVQVTAPASLPINATSRQDFNGWPGGNGNVWSGTLAAGVTTLTANYHLMNLLTVSSSPANAASWTFQPPSPDGFYDALSSVTVSVAGQPGYSFSNWTGDLNGSSPTATLSMNVPHSIGAVFIKAPYIAPTGVSNAAGATPETGVAPGSIVSIFGANLTGSTAVGPGSPLVQTLGGVTVTANGNLLPLYFVSPTQINVQLPSEMVPGAASLTVNATGQAPVTASFTIVQDAPGLFEQSVNAQNYALVAHADGSLVTPSSPAQQGETLTLYGTGFGSTTPARPDGFAIPATPPFPINDPLALQIAGVAIVPQAAFALPGSVGVDVVQFQLTPAVPAASNSNLYVTVNGQSSNIVVLPVQ